ncbi:glutamate [NMDA] receptor subunit 1-like isoform X1 [Daphnia pulex]|uniref:glutamate [NMDA] receptor subunit 1-like isoform X1 n=1 Tax=Daphnia pulex TaxID=6669 RepID=UPI001EE140E5|nr:glutamate [NMDA] receptor subunit 1-like isoform X1 [Daphnia pulex]
MMLIKKWFTVSRWMKFSEIFLATISVTKRHVNVPGRSKRKILLTSASTQPRINEIKNVDSITSTFHLTADRVAKNDPTSFIWTEGMTLIVPRPEEENRLFAFIGPFQPMVWLLIFISIFPVIGAMTFFTWFYQHLHWNNDAAKNNNSIRWFTTIPSSHMIYVINTLTNQGGREAFNRFSFRVLTGVWVLCAMVLVNCYTGIVTSSLTTPKMKPTINSFEDLAASEEVGIVLRSDTTIGNQILKATSGIYKVLGDEARRNPNQIVDNPFKLTATLETGRYAYPYLHSLCYAFVCSQYEKDGMCRFKLSKLLPVSIGFTSLFFKKGSLFTKDMDKGLMELWESGLVRLWINNIHSTPKAKQCFADTKRGVTRVVPIQLSDLISAFFILAIGIGLATLSFLLEIILSTLRRERL